MVVANNEIDNDENAGKLPAISIANRRRRYDARRISQWSTSKALLEVTGIRHWVSACTLTPRWPPWLMISNETQKHYQNTTFSQQLSSFFFQTE
jgi:hypothetical protein